MDTRKLLVVNAVVSCGCGLLLVLAPGTVANWLGTEATTVLRLFGAVLLAHAVLIPLLLSRLTLATVARLNLAAIAPYPVLVVALVVVGVIDRPAGIVIALVDAAIIGAIAMALFAGLRRRHGGVQPVVA